ncbi:MCE family protein [Nocardioides aurantiacus]|uniref:MCE family protein n=1 Tax=Nocardioides aurantiacus TaxID=86796 RepID=UPI00403F39C1
MRTPRSLARVVVGLVAGGLVLSGCSVYDAPLPGGPDTGDSPIKVTARFRDVLDLVPQSTVKIDDVSVGKVTKVDLKGYVAEVTLRLPKDVKLPDNARAQIRQTSLLGEKFVSLAPPEDPSDARLSNGDVIGLDRTGRNPEIEEVFSALALLLNGGGVGQLKTIVSELNNTFEGREDEVRSVLTQLRSFTGQLDERRADIVAAIENTNRLAAAAREQSGTIENALDDIPGALRSLNRQRDDLVKLLKALNRLSDVGVRVIRASKESTINTLRDLGPVLDNLAAAGDNLPKSFQVFLTYPFIDEAVGRNPVVANSIKMGDYTNLSVDLDLDLADLPGLPGLPGLPDVVCDTLGQVQRETVRRSRDAAKQVVQPLKEAGAPAAVTDAIEDDLVTALVDRVLGQAKRQCEAPDLDALLNFGRGELDGVIEDLPKRLRDLLNAVPGIGDVVGDVLGGVTGGLTGGGTTAGSGGGGTGGGSDGLGGVLGNRPAPFRVEDDRQIDPFGLARHGFDPGVGTLLLQGVATQR